MTHECKQNTTTSGTHAKKNFQVNTFHDDFKAWMDIYRHCVCPWSYLKYAIATYTVKLWQSDRGIPVAIVTLSNLHGLCSFNAQFFNDDVTAIGASYWRRREFPNHTRLHRGRIAYQPVYLIVSCITENRLNSFGLNCQERAGVLHGIDYILVEGSISSSGFWQVCFISERPD